jgi:protein TonB
VHRSGTITNDDYPASAIRAEAQGSTTMRLSISADGRVSACSVTGSSGNSALDSTACSLAQRRFRYTPAQDTSGSPVAGTVSRTVRWQLPDE